jgi:hypothetical protein
MYHTYKEISHNIGMKVFKTVIVILFCSLFVACKRKPPSYVASDPFGKDTAVTYETEVALPKIIQVPKGSPEAKSLFAKRKESREEKRKEFARIEMFKAIEKDRSLRSKKH